MTEPKDSRPEIMQEPEKSAPVEEIDKELEDAKINIGNIFDEKNKDGKAVVKEILSRIKPVLERAFKNEKVEEIEFALKECETIKDREEFVEKVFAAGLPLWEFRKNNPKEYEKFDREIAMQSMNLIKLSEVLYYNENKEEGRVSIHLAPARTLGIAETNK